MKHISYKTAPLCHVPKSGHDVKTLLVHETCKLYSFKLYYI